MKALVTGVAGFIGSAVALELLGSGWGVLGVDSLTDYYDIAQKRQNLASLQSNGRFEFDQIDVATARDLRSLLDGVDTVFHLAGQPGVRGSWGADFELYVDRNVVATQRLLEASVGQSLERFVFAGSSSAYGAALRYPVDETVLPRPISPYGVTKLAAEHLALLYHREFGVPTASLRYFTVYGPRQRPDMAIHRLFKCGITGSSFTLNGNGEQVRDFTFVGDVVRATILAAEAPSAVGGVFNVGGGELTSMKSLIGMVEDTLEAQIDVRQSGPAHGDPAITGADTGKAREELGWQPEVSLVEGLEEQCRWHREQRNS